ncbi:hypothetical protein [Streptomyces sp. NPDC057877]|uniref:hypothetical protein n=1 Tax=Streptomyces sp. NPDC057877 TaxID=3346269 RepID=UPI0036D0D36A
MRSTEEVVGSLRKALLGVGVVLPGLRVDSVLVDLGRCNTRVADRLASALRGERPVVGGYVVDERDDRLGEVMGHVGSAVQLRPLGGGREWDCPPELLRAARQDEVLREHVRLVNRGSWTGRW